MNNSPHIVKAELQRQTILELKLARRKVYGFDGIEIDALIARLENCNSPKNLFTAEDAINYDTGELYKSTGRLWICGSKLCAYCCGAIARRHRKKLREFLKSTRILTGERLNFLTFTIVNPALPLRQTRDLVARSWELFRKRQLVSDLFRAGFKSEEFTVTDTGYHYHIHLLAVTKWLLYNEVRRTWTECVKTAFAEAGIPLVINNADGMLSVKIQRVKSAEEAILEVTKYITKSDSWTKLQHSTLIEIALIRRWNRMSEFCGQWRQKKQEVDSEDEPILDTTDLNDGLSRPKPLYWRDFVEKHGLAAYLERLDQEIITAQICRIEQLKRKWPHAYIEIDGVCVSC